MNCQQIKDYVLKKTGFNSIPDSYLFEYINEIMDSLVIESDSAGKKVVSYVYSIPNEWSDLPENCITVKRCFKDNSLCDDFLVENNQIQFRVPGEYRIEYITNHDYVKDLKDTPAINIIYHETLALGVAYKEANRVFMYDNQEVKLQLYGEYRTSLLKAINKASNVKRSRKRMKYADFF